MVVAGRPNRIAKLDACTTSTTKLQWVQSTPSILSGCRGSNLHSASYPSVLWSDRLATLRQASRDSLRGKKGDRKTWPASLPTRQICLWRPICDGISRVRACNARVSLPRISLPHAKTNFGKSCLGKCRFWMKAAGLFGASMGREHGHFTDTLHQNAAMASLAISVSSLLTMRKLVGAVGIELASLLSKSQRMRTLPTAL
jgi:hypothetical protein